MRLFALSQPPYCSPFVNIQEYSPCQHPAPLARLALHTARITTRVGAALRTKAPRACYKDQLSSQKHCHPNPIRKTTKSFIMPNLSKKEYKKESTPKALETPGSHTHMTACARGRLEPSVDILDPPVYRLILSSRSTEFRRYPAVFSAA